MKKVLLHICCGVCLSYPIDFLRDKGYHVTGFFFNPNIMPKDEYDLRYEALLKIADTKKVSVIHDTGGHDIWKNECGMMHAEREGGARCLKCFGLRLKRTFEFMQSQKYDFFATTLTVSPHKRSEDIFSIAKAIAANKFLEFDFKKNDGFKKTMLQAKEAGIYMQSYCGCGYSRVPAV
ncbi:MAG: epoxyqueuosine reductase QueH [Candidatus Omnitrophica bacterium]|jgi:hypothetical protein|nr:epoxyqueuosine reductase QueH [Candidatus Omnitrophota bacterium]MDD5080374.1 epoxyqueuosine reductase QueH [Candidatus Omnitrophota bacterium]MDD5440883.1 epoxyqueuosine reductase QueH [Candidatus Omnitrophota bacterium]